MEIKAKEPLQSYLKPKSTLKMTPMKIALTIRHNISKAMKNVTRKYSEKNHCFHKIIFSKDFINKTLDAMNFPLPMWLDMRCPHCPYDVVLYENVTNIDTVSDIFTGLMESNCTKPCTTARTKTRFPFHGTKNSLELPQYKTN